MFPRQSSRARAACGIVRCHPSQQTLLCRNCSYYITVVPPWRSRSLGSQMSLASQTKKLLRTFQRVVVTLAVLGLLTAAGFDCIHHGAHAGHHGMNATVQGVTSHGVGARHDSSHHGGGAGTHLVDLEPASQTDDVDDESDCTHCGAVQCFACVMPSAATITVVWLVSKKGRAKNLYAARPPSWRLERPPKAIL